MDNESDPTGIEASEAGCKLDAGKVRMGLVLDGFAKALIEVGKVGTHGAEKYSERGWMAVPNAIARYTDAMQRHHFEAVIDGPIDPKSGLLHAAHEAWNALARLHFIVEEMGNEQRENTGF